MKHLLILILVLILNVPGTASAQWVTIPDPTFVTWLNNNGFSSCLSGNQMDTTCSGVVSATAITCQNSAISNLDGIQYFDNLVKLVCSSNNLTDLPMLPSGLRYLNCNYNSLTQLPALPPLLDTLWCDQNAITSLPPLPSGLNDLSCYFNNITALPGLPSGLLALNCGRNQLTFLPALPSGLTSLACYYNQLTSLGASLPGALYYLQVGNNYLTSIPACPPQLIMLDVGYNQLTALPSLNTPLKQILCENNQITSLPALPNQLMVLKCSGNPLASLPSLPNTVTTLELSNCPVGSLPVLPNSLIWLKADGCQLAALPTLPPNLTLLYVQNNSLTQLPTLPNALNDLWCQNNLLTSVPALPPNVYKIYAFNNLFTTFPELPDSLNWLHIGFNPNLNCLPRLTRIVNLRFDVSNVQCIPNYGNVTNSTPALAGVPLCDAFNTNSCTFYYNLAGNIYRDLNSNCVPDAGEQSLNGLKVNVYQGGTLVQQGYSSQAGSYTINTGLGTYDFTVDTVDAPFIVSCPTGGTYTSVLTPADSIDLGMDFGLQCKPGFDVGVQNMVQDSGIFRPGNPVMVKVRAGDFSSLYNLQCAAGVSGTVTIYFSGPVTYSGPATGSYIPTVGSNFIQYSISNFGSINFGNEFRFVMMVDTNALSGQQACFVVDVSPTGGDIYPNNNQLTHCFNVLNSFDPNDKQVSPTGPIETNQQWLTYTIRFQNTGTAPAQHIVIRDTLQPGLDVASFRYLGSSHQPLVEVNNNIAIFSFAHINLPDSTSDEPNSHGYVQFKIKYNPGLPVGSTITNTAAIYFDFNSPVITNTTSNTLVAPTAIHDQEYLFNLYPVPASDQLHIAMDKPGSYRAKIYDISGRMIKAFVMEGIGHTLSLHDFPAGMYMIELAGDAIKPVSLKIVIMK